MVKDREDEVGQAENENKLQQVQDRFPNDDLLLTERELPKEVSSHGVMFLLSEGI